ncbi:hypothetical protein TVAG_380160 [Trichomonas vaginalis G3]|uniref:Uncharacterized protein n=1 Tax=Trichomonas vaginalis (strain ATCC PRA-98 / G3) TaxID=412133 RepID=A2DXF4_TRIV3|nr:Sds3 2 family [Trichomonas vaginalis G3]EAY14906.1 hypothetical protein TVAG_380160 [Trichomonas vaginalis G3]KAI5485426.1 Sds3 2 family [Trichomonas vaginalis G3]|eukprot:XP_001327129.1 hypothetical protein [Trichomonas vaginalis G3]
MTNMFQSVAEIEIPNDLSDVDKAEFTAFKLALVDLEKEWNQLQDGTNPDQQTCLSIINDVKEKRIAQADERYKLRTEIIEKQTEKEREKIKQEQEEYKKLLFERLVRSYYQAYQSVTAQLKDLMGKDYSQYISQNGITFPNIPSEVQMRTRMQPNEEAKIKLTPAENEHDMRLIQQIIQGADQ